MLEHKEVVPLTAAEHAQHELDKILASDALGQIDGQEHCPDCLKVVRVDEDGRIKCHDNSSGVVCEWGMDNV